MAIHFVCPLQELLGRTGMLVWGSNGNEAQHSFYQWLRDGTGSTNIDLIWSAIVDTALKYGAFGSRATNASACARALAKSTR